MSLASADPLSFLDDTDQVAREAARQSLAACVSKTHGVGSFPGAAQKLLQSTQGRDYCPTEATATIEGDSSLAARILRVVNSPAYGLRMRCRKIRIAVTLLGPRRLRQIATTAAALDWFSDDSPAVTAIFKHSSATALLARQLAAGLGLAADELYTCGLLHDFGKLMMIHAGDDRYAPILAKTADQIDSADVLEREVYGYDHALLGAIVLAGWNIPEPLPNVIAWHHQPQRAFKAGGLLGKMVATLRFAEHLAHAFERGDTIDAAWLARMAQDESAIHLNLTRDGFDRLCRDLQAKYVESLKISLLDEAPPDDEYWDEGRVGEALSQEPAASSSPGAASAAEAEPKVIIAADKAAPPDPAAVADSPASASAELGASGESGTLDAATGAPRPDEDDKNEESDKNEENDKEPARTPDDRVITAASPSEPGLPAVERPSPVVVPNRQKRPVLGIVAGLGLAALGLFFALQPGLEGIAVFLWAVVLIGVAVALARRHGAAEKSAPALR